MERSSRVLQHGNPKIWFFFFQKKFKIQILTFDEELKSFTGVIPTLQLLCVVFFTYLISLVPFVFNYVFEYLLIESYYAFLSNLNL